jgi:hypothetical protein
VGVFAAALIFALRSNVKGKEHSVGKNEIAYSKHFHRLLQLRGNPL